MDNRELYLAVTRLVAAHEGGGRSLEDYLRTLHAALAADLEGPGLAPERFVALLEQAFVAPVPARDETWRAVDLSDPDPESRTDADHVERVLRSQILDMEDAAASGALADEMRSFGRLVGRPEAPARATGGHWFNWSPASFLECGAEGAFGGWQPGDETGRVQVPGEVAVMRPEGLTSVPADQIDHPIRDLPLLSWEQVSDFLWAGQHYE